MIKESNERLTITLSKKQIKWLKEASKKLDISISNFVKFLISKNIANILNNSFNEKELKELYKIAQVKWLDM